MKIGALVPARGGSKRLPKKNILELCGKPLINWTLDVLLDTNIFFDITVSTDSIEIADCVKANYPGKEVKILMRPKELATDDAPLTSVVFHYLEHRPDLDWIGLFMPTYPFRKKERLLEIYSAILSGYPWKVVSVMPEEVCLMDYYYPVPGGVKRFFHDPALFCRANLCAYLLWHRLAVDEGPAKGSRLWGIYGLTITEREYRPHLTYEECIDIDTKEDLLVAEKIAKGGKFKVLSPVVHSYNEWTIIVPEGVDLNAFLDFVGKEKFQNYNLPLLILEEAYPPLGFVRIQDGSVRRYFIRPEGLDLVNSEELKKSGNSKYIVNHFRQNPYYRIIRINSNDKNNILKSPDLWGINFGINNEIIPEQRIIYYDCLKKEAFFKPPKIIVNRSQYV